MFLNHKLFRRICLFLVAFAAFTAPIAANAQTDDAARMDAIPYANDHQISVEEAMARLSLQNQTGELEARMRASEPTFAGMWIEHTPTFRIVVQFTKDAEKTASKYLKNSPLAAHTTVRTATYTLNELEAAQAESLNVVNGLNMQANSGINVRANRVELYVTNNDVTAAPVRRLSAAVQTVVVPAVGTTAEAEVYGGLSLSTCTSGFAVKNSSGTKGISTAAHCGNTQSFGSIALTFQSEKYTGSYDIQWHTAPGHTIVNKIKTTTGGSTRNITATMSRSSQTIGSYVCKFGKTTGYTCGTISDKNFSLGSGYNATFIRVDNSSASYPDLSSGGDSGGPWFNSNTAYGSHHGAPNADPNDAIYMAVDYMSGGIGVTVMTAP